MAFKGCQKPPKRTTVGLAADQVGLSRDVVREIARRGEISYVQVPGGRMLVDPGELKLLVERSTHPARIHQP